VSVSKDEELEKELEDPQLKADTRALDLGCSGCLVVLVFCLVGILLFLLISPGRGHYRFFQGPSSP